MSARLQRAGNGSKIRTYPCGGLFEATTGGDLRYELACACKDQDMALDLILRNARIAGREPHILDIAIEGGRIVEIASGITADAPEDDVGGRLVCAGFIETHIHLDKSCILDRCLSRLGTLAEAIAEVAAAKRDFSEDDIYQRGG